MGEGVQLPWPGTPGSEQYREGQPWKRGCSFLSLAPQGQSGKRVSQWLKWRFIFSA